MKNRLFYGGMIVLICAMWGLGNPMIKLAGEALPPFWSVAMRFTLATTLYLLCFGRRFARGVRTVRWAPTLLICVFSASAFILASIALMLTEAVIAGFLMCLAVLFTPLLAPLLLRKRFNARILPLVALVCVGLYLLCGGGAFTFGVGELLALLCSLSYALMLTLSEKYIGEMDTIVLSTLQCAVAAVLSIAFALLLDGPLDLSRVTWGGMGAIGYIVVFSTFLAYLLQNRAIRHVPATFASLTFSTEPVFTALFSFILLGETLTGAGYAGAGLILAGVMAASVLGEGRAAAL